VLTYGHGDVQLFEKVKQPAYINGNAYFNGAKAFAKEKDNLLWNTNPEASIVSKKMIYIYRLRCRKNSLR
ncbi:MAG: hypothetical protein MR531_14345, partial [Lachnospiraceae bacterium]|nr:hypothetical protein [Lachnospiraceae bacterium]